MNKEQNDSKKLKIQLVEFILCLKRLKIKIKSRNLIEFKFFPLLKLKFKSVFILFTDVFDILLIIINISPNEILKLLFLVNVYINCSGFAALIFNIKDESD